MSLGRYSKFWIALIAAIVSLVGLYYGAQPWFPILVSFVSAIGVYATPNTN